MNYFKGVQEVVLKNFAKCILQTYIGTFLQEKLNVDQLTSSLDSQTGKCSIENVSLDASVPIYSELFSAV